MVGSSYSLSRGWEVIVAKSEVMVCGGEMEWCGSLANIWGGPTALRGSTWHGW